MTMVVLKESNIKGSDGYTLYEIPNVDNVMIGIHENDYITLLGLDPREQWYRLGDREDLKPDELKGFGLTSYRGGDEVKKEEFIARVLKAFPKRHTMNTTELIINKAMNIASSNFMDFPDYDESVPLTLADALTIIITHDEDHNTEMESDKVYELMDGIIEGGKCKLGCGRLHSQCNETCYF